jgi:hypothetical protein
VKLPGFGRPVGIIPSDVFPMLFAHNGDENNVWKAATLLIREVCMLRLVEELTNKPEWWRKVRDPAIAARWKAEALAFDWASYREHGDFTPAMADAVINELKVKAELFEKTGLVPVLDYSEAAIKSDVVMTEEMRAAIARVTAKPVLKVFVSNQHPDYFLGSQAFADVPIAPCSPISTGRGSCASASRVPSRGRSRSCSRPCRRPRHWTRTG